VTHFCKKHNLPIPDTQIFYEEADALAYLANTRYPKIIKKSYGPSNYGGYFVHKVDSEKEARALLKAKRYYPVYVQEFVPMMADIRVMLVGHKPVCAFWRRPPEGEWLTNTSQGGSMDYQNVPKAALDIAVKASKAANAEYWACDIALGVDGKYRILECATAFAAFPYVRDWIGQYLMWDLSGGSMRKPVIPAYNWEELGKIRSALLRTMRHISFGESTPSYDCADAMAMHNPEQYPLLPIELRLGAEEWPSEVWNFQDNYTPKRPTTKVTDLHLEHEEVGLEDAEIALATPATIQHLSQADLLRFFESVKGVGPKLVTQILNTLGVEGTAQALLKTPSDLLTVKNLKQKKLDIILAHWQDYQRKLERE